MIFAIFYVYFSEARKQSHIDTSISIHTVKMCWFSICLKSINGFTWFSPQIVAEFLFRCGYVAVCVCIWVCVCDALCLPASNIGRFAFVSFKAIQWKYITHNTDHILDTICTHKSILLNFHLPSYHHMPVHVYQSHKNQSDHLKQHSNQMAFSGRLDDRNRPHDFTHRNCVCVCVWVCVLLFRLFYSVLLWCRTLRTG